MIYCKVISGAAIFFVDNNLYTTKKVARQINNQIFGESMAKILVNNVQGSEETMAKILVNFGDQ